MCFEWDKRYFRELAEQKDREKVAELVRSAEESAKAEVPVEKGDAFVDPAPGQKERLTA